MIRWMRGNSLTIGQDPPSSTLNILLNFYSKAHVKLDRYHLVNFHLIAGVDNCDRRSSATSLGK